MIRLYEIDMLQYTASQIMRWHFQLRSAAEKDDIEYAFSTLAKIVMILHYSSFLWIYVGSEAFLDYEDDFLPWQYANTDFHGMDKYQIYVFSTYWVCTVISTVGYGDYSGGTTLEYLVTLFLESSGILVFALL